MIFYFFIHDTVENGCGTVEWLCMSETVPLNKIIVAEFYESIMAWNVNSQISFVYFLIFSSVQKLNFSIANEHFEFENRYDYLIEPQIGEEYHLLNIIRTIVG